MSSSSTAGEYLRSMRIKPSLYECPCPTITNAPSHGGLLESYLLMQKVITLIPSTPQCQPHSNMKGNKSRGQLIANYHVATQVRGFVSVGIRPPEINPCSIDANMSPDDHRGTPVRATGKLLMIYNVMFNCPKELDISKKTIWDPSFLGRKRR